MPTEKLTISGVENEHNLFKKGKKRYRYKGINGLLYER